jgi:hypothetical protein
MTLLSIDASSGAVRSVVAASTTRAAARRLVYGRQMSGGKGGNPVLRPHSGTQVFRDGRRGTAKGVAETAETPRTHHRGMRGGKGAKVGNLESAPPAPEEIAEIAKAAVGTATPTPSGPLAPTAPTASAGPAETTRLQSAAAARCSIAIAAGRLAFRKVLM